MVKRGEQLPAFVDEEALLALTACLLLLFPALLTDCLLPSRLGCIFRRMSQMVL